MTPEEEKALTSKIFKWVGDHHRLIISTLTALEVQKIGTEKLGDELKKVGEKMLEALPRDTDNHIAILAMAFYIESQFMKVVRETPEIMGMVT